MVEDSFSLLGAVLEVILMSGIDKILKLDTKVITPIFDQFGIRWQGKFKSDIQTLRMISKQGKKFAKQIGKAVGAKWLFKSTASDFMSELSSSKSNAIKGSSGGLLGNTEHFVNSVVNKTKNLLRDVEIETISSENSEKKK